MIQSLNAAMEEALPSLRRSADDLVGFDVVVSVVTFATSASLNGVERVPLQDFRWPDLEAEDQGLTELGAALDLVMTWPPPSDRELPPAIVLLTDGMPSDTLAPSFADALEAMSADPVLASAQRTAVAIGADADRQALARFVEPSGGDVSRADSPEQLAQVVRFAGTAVLQAASEPIW